MGSRVSEIRGSVGAGGGRTVGVAMGVIRINTGQLLTDADRAKSAFRAISKSGEDIGKGVAAGTNQAKRELTSLQQAAQGAARQLAAMFALPTAIAFTQQVQRTNVLIRALSGSEEVAARRMDELRKLADRTNQSFVEITRSATALLPAIGRNNVDLSQTVLLAQRLALLDPAQGIEGASLAIREILGGQYTSLAMRFELPRAQLRQLVEQAGGDPQQIINGLDQMIAQMGITEQTIVDMGESGINAFAKLKGEVIETTAVAFEPFLNNAIIPLVEATGDLVRSMREVNPELLEIGGTLGGILATVLALNAAGLGSPGVRGVAAIGAAGFIGIEAGTALARAGANTGTLNNSRLKGASQDEAKDIIGETFKQVVVLLADQMVEAGFKVAEGGVLLQNGFERAEITVEMIKTGLGIAQKIIETGFSNIGIVIENAGDQFANIIELIGLLLREAISSALDAIGGLIADIPGLKEQGLGIQNAANEGRAARQGRASELQREVENADLTSGITPLDNVLRPFLDDLEELQQMMADSPLGLTDAQKDNLEATKEEFRKRFVLPLADMLGLLGDEAESVSEQMRGALGGSNTSTGVEQVSDFTQEMLEAFKEFQDGIAELEKKAADDRKKATDEANKRRTEAETKYSKDVEKTVQEATKRRDKLIKDANSATEQAEIDHRERLKQINNSAFREALQAAARLDAVALRAALERRRENVDAENQNFERQRQQRDQRLEEELAEIQTSANERLDGLRESFKAEMVEIQAQRQARINEINTQLREEINARNLAFAEQHNKMVAEAGNHNIRMLNIQQQGTAALENQYRQWLERMGQQIGFVPSPVSATNALASGLSALSSVASGGTGGAIAQRTRSGSQGLAFTTRGFASGIGRVPRDMLAMVHQEETILNTTNAALIRSMTGSMNPSQSQIGAALVSGGGKGDFYFNGTIVLPDNVGSYSRAEIMALSREGAYQGIAEFWAKAAGE